MVDERALRSTIVGVQASQRALDEHLATIDVDPGRPSRLPGWTVGHVLTHLARNADSHREMLAGGQQYGGDRERRDRAIAAGARRDRDVLIDDVASSSAALVEAWTAADFSGSAILLNGGSTPADNLPLMRWREVEVHRFDLGSGHQFSEMPTEYVRRDLRVAGMRTRSRLPMGVDGPDLTRLEPWHRLGVMLGRLAPDDFDACPHPDD